LVEAGWAAARSPGPLRSFFLRVQSRRGQHVAAVATARKLAILIWHLLTKNENYLWARPALHARKLRDLELKAGHKPARGQKGRHMPTTSKASATRSAVGSSRPKRPMPGLSQVGTQEGQRRARAPQTRSDNRAARQGFHLVPCSLPRGHPCATADYQGARARHSQAWRRARDGQDQAASGGDLRSVLTTPARDALNLGRPGRRNGSPL